MFYDIWKQANSGKSCECLQNYFQGKQETFVKDVKYIINETGMISDLGNDIFNDTVVNEIKLLVEDYLNLKKPWLNSLYHNKTFICERLWLFFFFCLFVFLFVCFFFS